MIDVYYQTERLCSFIKEQLEIFTPQKVVWLGYSPGLPCVYEMLLSCGVQEIRVFDNDSHKHGWEIKAAGCEDKESITVEAFQNIEDGSSKIIYFSANTHYKDFTRQLSAFGVEEERIIDLNSILEKWMWEAEAKKVSGYHLLAGRELQLEQLKILKRFKAFCDGHNLRWFLGEGTLLGAVRHKGFIPWDDDIDVFMPFNDYLECIQSFEDDSCYLLDWRSEPTYPFQFAKIVEKNTYQIHSMPFGYFTLGCYIDIFPIAGFPSNEDEVLKKYQRHRVLDAEWDSTLILRDYYSDVRPDCRQKITDEKYRIPFDEAERVGTMQQIAGNPWAVSRDVFSESIDMQFEDEVFPIPIGFDEFLTARYGDYMTPPPKNKRRIHSYPTYRM